MHKSFLYKIFKNVKIMVIDIIRVATLGENGGIEGAFVFAGDVLCLNCLELYRYTSLCLFCKTSCSFTLETCALKVCMLNKKSLKESTLSKAISPCRKPTQGSHSQAEVLSTNTSTTRHVDGGISRGFQTSAFM